MEPDDGFKPLLAGAKPIKRVYDRYMVQCCILPVADKNTIPVESLQTGQQTETHSLWRIWLKHWRTSARAWWAQQTLLQLKHLCTYTWMIFR